MTIIKKIFLIFFTAFIFNLIWENLHSFLYTDFYGGKITEFILIRSTLVDAFIIVFLSLPFIFILSIKKLNLLIIPVGFVISILIEWWALGMGLWSYNVYMPIIPILAVGLTPALQLGLLGYISFKIQEYSLT